MAKGSGKPRAGAASSRADDEITCKPNGTIVGKVTGTGFALRRPTVGEQRDFAEALDVIAEAENVYNGLEPAARTAEMRLEHDRMLFDWWRTVFATLDKDGVTLPDEDRDMPTWFLADGLIAEVRNHWVSVPWGPGGSPSDQQAAKMAPLLGGLGNLAAAASQ